MHMMGLNENYFYLYKNVNRLGQEIRSCASFYVYVFIYYMEEIGKIEALSPDEIEFKKQTVREDKEAAVTFWISRSDRELYRLLKDEYGVDTPLEMKKAMSQRLRFLADKVIKGKAG